jgi:membrane protease YdiL (CAAX protease family)
VRLSTGRDWVPHLASSNLPAQLVLSTIGVVAVLAVASVLFRAFSSIIPPLQFIEPGIMEEMVKQFREWPAGVAVLLVGVGPGLGEELWCRAFLGRGLVGRHGVVMGVILTSFFFGAIHADPHQGSMAALMGIALHFSYITTRSLWVPVLIHTLNNSLAVVADKLPDLLRENLEGAETAPDTVKPLLYAASVLLVVAVGWALYASRARLKRVDGSDEPAWQPPFPGVALPPEGSGTAAVAVWPGVLPVVGVLLGLAAFVGAFLLVPGNG